MGLCSLARCLSTIIKSDTRNAFWVEAPFCDARFNGRLIFDRRTSILAIGAYDKNASERLQIDKLLKHHAAAFKQ